MSIKNYMYVYIYNLMFVLAKFKRKFERNQKNKKKKFKKNNINKKGLIFLNYYTCFFKIISLIFFFIFYIKIK